MIWTCELCGGEGYNRLGKHLEKEHPEISSKEYYDKYIGGKYEGFNTGVCGNPGCVKPCLYRYINIGYRPFCSHSCRAQVNNNKEKFKKAKSEMAKKAHADPDSKMKVSNQLQDPNSKRNSKEHKAYLAETARKRSLDPNERFGFKVLNEYKRTHDGLSPCEYALFSDPRFQKLRPLTQDARFNNTHNGNSRVIMDFSLPHFKINIEIDGVFHYPQHDMKRDRYLESQGWRVLRFTNTEIENDLDSVIGRIMTFIRNFTKEVK